MRPKAITINLLFITFLFAIHVSYSQVNDSTVAKKDSTAVPNPFKGGGKNKSLLNNNRVVFGGNFGFSSSNGKTSLEISPSVGYKFTPKLLGTVGIVYQYYKEKYSSSGLGADKNRTTNVYGLRISARYNIKGPIYVQGEAENLNLEYYNDVTQRLERGWVPGLMLGGGITQPIGGKGSISVSLLYNLLYEDHKSPYNSEFVYRVNVYF